MTKEDNLVRGKILKGMELTYTRLIKSKKERNLDLIVSKKGKIVRIPAKDLDTWLEAPLHNCTPTAYKKESYSGSPFLFYHIDKEPNPERKLLIQSYASS